MSHPADVLGPKKINLVFVGSTTISTPDLDQSVILDTHLVNVGLLLLPSPALKTVFFASNTVRAGFLNHCFKLEKRSAHSLD